MLAELLALPLPLGEAPVVPPCRMASLLLRFRCFVCFSFNRSVAGMLMGTCAPELLVYGCACCSPVPVVLYGSGSADTACRTSAT